MKKEETVNAIVVVFFIIGFVLLCLCSESITGFSVKDFDNLGVKEADVIVSLKEKSFYSDKDTIKSQQDKFVKLNDLRVKRKYDNINAISLRIDKKDLEKIFKDENVKSVSLDRKFEISLDSARSLVQADLVWDKSAGGVNLTGERSVCVLDTGADYNHGSLNGRVILGPDFVNDDMDPYDDHGHGTHVSGIIISGDGTYRGIANSGKVAAVKVMDSSGNGVGGDIIAGIDWCINNKDLYNISVISMSIGASLFSEVCDDVYPELTNIINQAVLNGIIAVSSSGNDGSSNSLSLPACISSVNSAGAVSDSDIVAGSSNSANFLDFLGPGVGIVSSKIGGGFVSMSGTSMAAPFIPAAILIVEQYASLENLNVNAVDVLKNSGDLVVDSRNGLEFPRLNVFRALVSLDSFEPLLNISYSDVYDDKQIILRGEASDTFLDSVVLEIGNESYLTDEYVLEGFAGEEVSFKFVANDSAGNVKEETANFTVLDGSPVVSDVDSLSAVLNEEFSYEILAVDPTNDSLCFSDDSDLFDIGADGLISFVPSETGVFNISIIVSDGFHNVSEDFVLEILSNNSAPEILSYSPLDLDVFINENESLEFFVDYEDLDSDVSVGWYLDGELVGVNDSYTFLTNYLSAGEYSVKVAVSDGIDSDSVNWSLEVVDVNLIPIYSGGLLNISFDEGSLYSLDLDDYFIDLDLDVLNYSVSGIDFVLNGSVIRLESSFNGSYFVKFFGCDEAVCAESDLIEVVVNNVVVCGDGLVEGSEECEGLDLGCVDFDYDSGSLICSNCMFNFSLCSIAPPSSNSGTPSGGGGTKLSDDDSEETTVNVEEKEGVVEEEIKAEEKLFESTGEVVKEEVKPKGSIARRVFVKIGDFFRGVWYRILSILK